MALLHSSEFAESRQTFAAVAEANPDRVTAHWLAAADSPRPEIAEAREYLASGD